MAARLNGALRDLLSSHQGGSISGFATKWEFRHMPRFADNYRKAFGDLPRDTLRLTGTDLNDFADSAALAENLDLIITVDTSAAHLAGSLGRPTWLLLPAMPDWRWQLNRSDTPRHPTVTLHRRGQDWGELLQKLKETLLTGV